MEDKVKKRGGVRERSGRKSHDLKAMSLKLERELFEKLETNGINKNGFINKAVRQLLIKEGLM